MSQTPWPYPPTNPYPQTGYYAPYPADPYRPLLAPARRAAIVVFVVAGLMALCGVGVGGIALIMPPTALERVMENAQSPDLPASAIRIGFAVIGCGTLLMGLGLLASGIYVWRGSPPAIITALVLTLICLLLALVNAAVSLPHAGRMTNPSEWAGAGCSMIVAPLVLVLMFAFLLQGLKSARIYRQTLAQYQMQYWQYQQAQQMYQQQAAQPAPSPPSPAGGAGGTS